MSLLWCFCLSGAKCSRTVYSKCETSKFFHLLNIPNRLLSIFIEFFRHLEMLICNIGNDYQTQIHTLSQRSREPFQHERTHSLSPISMYSHKYAYDNFSDFQWIFEYFIGQNVGRLNSIK